MSQIKYSYIAIILLVVLTACTSNEVQDIEPRPILEDNDLEAELNVVLDLLGTPGTSSSVLSTRINELAATNDSRLIVPFVDLLRFSEGSVAASLNNALTRITGEDHNSWGSWMTYLGNQNNIILPSGYLDWKARKLSFIDPNFRRFFEDGKKQDPLFRPELAVWGGVRVAIAPGVDVGIPPLENPAVVTAEQATYMRDNDLVYGMVINGKARAYPQRIIDWHEMVNDVIEGKHFTIAYCTLCGAAIAYDTELANGSFRTFSSSGMLYESNKLMFDRQTETLWNHLLGVPVLGPLVGEVDELPLLFIEYTTWKEWREDHPDTEIIDINTGFDRDYSQGVPSYNRYYESPDTLFPTAQVSGPFDPKDRIFGIRIDGVAKAYLRFDIHEQRIINDVIGDTSIVIINNGENTGIRVYESSETFSLQDSSSELTDSNGDVWTITDEALILGDKSLQRIPAHEAFWFGWVLNHPNTEVYQ